MRIAFMSGEIADSRRRDFPSLEATFDDTVETWTGYPLLEDNVSFRPRLFLSERNRLTDLFGEIHELIFADRGEQTTTLRHFDNAVNGMLARLEHWFEYLPEELQYHWPMSTAVWELQ